MRTRKKKTLDQYAFGTGISSVGKVPTAAGVLGDISSDFLMQQAIGGIQSLLSGNTNDNPIDFLQDQTGGVFAFGGEVGDDLPGVGKKKIRKAKGDGSAVGNFGAKVLNMLQSPEAENGIKTFRKVGKPIIQLADPTGMTNWQDAMDSWTNPNATGLDRALNTVSAIPFGGEMLGGLGKIAKQAGKSEMGWKLFNKMGDVKQLSEAFAYGGEVVGSNVEVEGDEVAETPMGDMMQFDGPSHEAGGIDVNLPVGTKIFSDRIAIDGKTMQERKKKRESKINKLIKAGDTVLDKNTLNRTQKFLDLEEEGDLMIQEAANQANTRKFAYGTGDTGIDGDPDPLEEMYKSMGLPSPNNASSLPLVGTLPNLTAPATATNPINPVNTDMPFSTGDITGMIGNAFGGLAPLATTIANRAGDTPNVNKFKNFGNDALLANNKAKGSAAAVRDNTMQNIQLQKNTARARNRNSATGVNTLRALDFATDAMGNQAEGNADSAYEQQLMQLFSQEAQLQNQQDQVVMGGDQAADLADRQDRDAYYTNLGEGFVGLSNAAQKTGKDLNQHEQNNDILALLPELSKYGVGVVYDKNGKPTLKKVK